MEDTILDKRVGTKSWTQFNRMEKIQKNWHLVLYQIKSQKGFSAAGISGMRRLQPCTMDIYLNS
jgi:hypothetical protein